MQQSFKQVSELRRETVGQFDVLFRRQLRHESNHSKKNKSATDYADSYVHREPRTGHAQRLSDALLLPRTVTGVSTSAQPTNFQLSLSFVEIPRFEQTERMHCENFSVPATNESISRDGCHENGLAEPESVQLKVVHA